MSKFKVGMVSLGCDKNRVDSELILGSINKFYEITNNPKDAEIIIINTCGFIESAKQESIDTILEMAEYKKTHKCKMIIATGCLTQRYGDELLELIPEIDILMGVNDYMKLHKLIVDFIKTEQRVSSTTYKDEGVNEGERILTTNSHTAYLRIAEGCNNFCTYCIVPYVRGRERSRKPEDIIKEIKDLVAQGYKEITLLGQNVNSYGKGLESEVSFADLLRMINEIEGLERLRFMTSHPKDLNDDVIKAVKECGKLCEQIHLPVQSGSDRILKKMNRHYTREYYMSLVNKIKKEIPDVSLTTDIIVGFPGETEEDFLDTLELAKEVQYDSAFTFIYSRRNNTPADMMLDQVSEEDKHNRFNRLVEVINSSVIAKNKAYDGKVVEVLVEGTSKNDESKLSGRTRNGRLVNFTGENIKIGDLVNVKITKTQNFSLVGEAVK